MKRRGLIALCVLMLSAIFALGLSACETETGQPEHIHTFSQEWTYSDTHHWHVAICGHEDEVSDYAENTFQSGACTVCACPQPSTQGLEYTLINGDTAYEVSGIGMEKERDIVIPDTYHGLPVISIGVGAFSGCSSLTSVTIGNGVTSIGIDAFSGCSGLTGELVIPDGVTSIGNNAFVGCSGLTSVTIGNGVTSIGIDAFSGCSGLTGELVIPDGVTSIGNNAFVGCSGLTNVTIGNGVTSIGKHVFSDCSGLENIAVKDGNTVYCSAGKCLVEKATKMLLLGCKNSVIPSDGSVTSIGEGAFYGCNGLIEFMIPDSVTSIGYIAFSGCSSLTSVTFENPDGWWITPFATATSGTSISSNNLSDLATAAEYLTSAYCGYYWKRS